MPHFELTKNQQPKQLESSFQFTAEANFVYHHHTSIYSERRHGHGTPCTVVGQRHGKGLQESIFDSHSLVKNAVSCYNSYIICVCVCVCKRKRKSEGESKLQSRKISIKLILHLENLVILCHLERLRLNP